MLIGGSPMIGKTTASKRIASAYGISCMSTDDIGEILQTAADINPMKGLNYLDYYESKSFDTQIDDLKKYHKHIEKAILKMVEIHSTWGSSMVIEGYAIYPHSVDFENPNVDSVWLIASEELLRSRLEKSQAFENASPRARESYLSRSIWHNRLIENECKTMNCKHLYVDTSETADALMMRIIEKTTVFCK